MFMADKHMTSSSVHIVKTHYLARAESNKTSETLTDVLVEKCADRGIKLSYDITYGGHPEDLRYTEFFAGLGGIQITPCSGDIVRILFDNEYDTSNNIDFATLLTKEVYDKYIVYDYDTKPMRGLVILPGSNILTKLVDKEKLNAAVLLGAKVKPHPLTNQGDIDFLVKEYGEDAILPKMYSGYKAMTNSNVLYATGSTELALYGMLLGKRVIDIGNNEPVGGYSDIYHHVIDAPDQKTALNFILNNPSSGIVFQKDKIDTYLDIYQKMLDQDNLSVPNLSKYDML